jgi:hypothetical protein
MKFRSRAIFGLNDHVNLKNTIYFAVYFAVYFVLKDEIPQPCDFWVKLFYKYRDYLKK